MKVREPLLDVAGLTVDFPIRGGLLGRPKGWLRAVDSVSFTIQAGETLGLVGESGCGKTTVGLALCRLVKASEGEVRFQGQDVTKLDRQALRSVRRELQIVFQDPYSSLNPRLSVGERIGEPLLVRGLAKGA